MNANRPASDLRDPNQDIQQGDRLSPSRFALFFIPCVIGLAADLGTKSFMFSHYFNPALGDRFSPEYGAQQKHWWIDGIFGFQTSTNPGALFGIGSGLSWLFAAFSVVAVLGILVWLFWFGGYRDKWLTFSLGLISGGILGNLYDRVGLGFTPGFPDSIRYNVRDWILFELEGVRGFDPWPNFNIADACLVCGAILLLIHAMFLQPGPVEQAENPGDATLESANHHV